MSVSPTPKKRKLESSFGDSHDNIRPGPSNTAKQAGQVSKRPACGDSVCGRHQHTAFISNGGPGSREAYSVVRVTCALGDNWADRYPLPLGSLPMGLTKDDDPVLADLPGLGYRPLEILFDGQFGTLVLAQETGGACSVRNEYVPVVVKIFSAVRPAEADPFDGVQLHRQLDHHVNIVAFLDDFSLRGRCALVMEFCENGNLDQLLRVLDARFVTEPVARRYFRQLTAAVDHIHGRGIAHRNISPRNILVSSKNLVKLSDFRQAVAHACTDPYRQDLCGTPGYQAPEMLMKHRYVPFQADVYSLGCVLYTMTVGKIPAGVNFLKKAFTEKPQNLLHLTDELKDLLKGILYPNPRDRFTLNRTINSYWQRTVDQRVQIGNFYILQQPQKVEEGVLERQIKRELEI